MLAGAMVIAPARTIVAIGSKSIVALTGVDIVEDGDNCGCGFCFHGFVIFVVAFVLAFVMAFIIVAS